MKRFEIWLIRFDPSKGAENKRTRPAVIISPNTINTHLQTVIVAPLTSAVRNYPSRIPTIFDNKRGQIALDQLRTVDKSRLVKKIGALEVNEGKAVCQLLQIMFEE